MEIVIFDQLARLEWKSPEYFLIGAKNGDDVASSYLQYLVHIHIVDKPTGPFAEPLPPHCTRNHTHQHHTMASAMSATPRSIFTIGTRKSKLAMLQTELVRDTLTAAFPHLAFETCTRDTAGDRNKTTPLSQFAGKNLWTEELEELLAAGEIDFVVHSLKGMCVCAPEASLSRWPRDGWMDTDPEPRSNKN